MITLYFEGITPDKTIAVQTNGDAILYNLAQIDKVLSDMGQSGLSENNQFSTIFPLGTFVCSVTMSLDAKECSMMMIDYKKDDEAAMSYANTLNPYPTLRRTFLDAYASINMKFYNFPDFKLVMGDIPTGGN